MSGMHAIGQTKFAKTGLDEVLPGGLPANHLYLVEGVPGTGKTTQALQFLLEGRQLGERGLYVTLSETKEELLAVAESHGWSLDGIELSELEASQARLKPEQEYTVFHPERSRVDGNRPAGLSGGGTHQAHSSGIGFALRIAPALARTAPI